MTKIRIATGIVTRLLTLCSFVPLLGVPFSFIFIVIGLTSFRNGGKRLVLLGVVGVSFTIVPLLCLSTYLLKDTPSIYDRPKPFCEGKNSRVVVEYLSFEKIPNPTLSILEVAEPDIYLGVSRVLARKRSKERENQIFWHLRNIVTTLWLRQYNESDLVAYYLNGNYFGDGCYGIGSAAKVYFNKDARSLTPEESAKLFAMIKSYSYYSIVDQPDRNKERADILMNGVLKKKKSE